MSENAIERKVAFAHFERRVLIDLVQRHRDVVNDRRTDSTSVHRKQESWQQITLEYNRHPSIGRRREVQQLKRLWQNTRARAKQAVGRVFAQSARKNGHSAADGSKNNRSESAVDSSENSSPSQVDVESFLQPMGSDEELQNIDTCLNPFIAVRRKKIEDSIMQQAELHCAQMHREQLACKSTLDEMRRLAENHSLQMQRERELHELLIKNEVERHAQQMRFDQELHKLKLTEEHHKSQQITPRFPVMYK